MSGYKRFVSYIYAYKQGRKMQNAGFAKVESRNDICKIQIHLQDISEERGELQVYAFVREGEWLKGILLGKASIQMPSTEIKIMTPSEHVGNVDYKLENLAGLWISSDHDGIYLSVWDDEPVEIHKLVTELPGKKEADGDESHTEPEEIQLIREEAIEDIPSPEEKSGEEKMQMEAEEASGEGQAETEEVSGEGQSETEEVSGEGKAETEEVSGEGQAETEEVSGEGQAETVEVSEEAKQKVRSESNQQRPPIQAQEAAACPMPQSLRNNCRNCAQGLDQRWQCLARRYSHIQPFEGDEVLDGIRICPRDLGVLRQNQWQLGRNSFLMHGYYNYRHLLFGKCRDGSYFLGIPGIKDSQEEFMASMFGFPCFRKASEQTGSGIFGYWCRQVE